MFRTSIKPRFNETDALGHISNTVIPCWCESARADLFENIVPDWRLEDWPIILAHYSVNFIQQIFIHFPVMVTTRVTKIGTSSFTVFHEIYQQDQVVCTSETVLVHYDFKSQKSTPIAEDIRFRLEKILDRETPQN